MSTPQIIAGYDTELTVHLVDENGNPADVSGASSLEVALVDREREGVVLGPYTASSGHTGAVWAQGKIVITVPADDTEDLAGERLFADAKAVVSTEDRPYFGEQIVLVRAFLL